jgi:tetratricopeptide (TPR) repeat protein
MGRRAVLVLGVVALAVLGAAWYAAGSPSRSSTETVPAELVLSAVQTGSGSWVRYIVTVKNAGDVDFSGQVVLLNRADPLAGSGNSSTSPVTPPKLPTRVPQLPAEAPDAGYEIHVVVPARQTVVRVITAPDRYTMVAAAQDPDGSVVQSASVDRSLYIPVAVLSPSAVAVECLIDSAAFAYLEGQPNEARKRLDRALKAGEAAADDHLVGRALYMSGLVEAATGDPVRAEAHLEQALPLWHALADAGMEAEILHQMGLLAGGRGDVAAAETLFQRSLDLRNEADGGDEAHITLTFIAAVRVTRDDVEGARKAVRESLEIGQRLGDKRAAWTLDVCSCIAVADHQAERCLVLAGAAASIHKSAGTTPPDNWQALMRSFTNRARSALLPDEAAAAWERGRALSYRAAIEYALAMDEQPAR